MSNGNDANEFLMSGGAPGISFKTIGTSVRGQIVSEPTKRPVTDTKGNIRTFPNGDTIYQIVVEVQTGLRDPERPDDNGVRSLWVKNKMLAAVREAVKRTGAPGLQVGGWLTVTFIGEEQSAVKGNDPTKLYSANYEPAPSAGNAALMGGDGAAQYAPAGYQAPPVAGASGIPWPAGQAPWLGPNGQPVAAGYAAPPAPAGYAAPPADVYAQTAAAAAVQQAPPPPAPPGVDPNVWARMDEGQRAAVMAAMGNVAPF